jgi:hypothetical protein
MADNPPISTESPETVTVDTGASKESISDLNAQFADFWEKEDAKPSSDAPEAPTEAEPKGAAQETKTEPAPKPVEPPIKPVEPLSKPLEPPSKPPAREVTDDEIERMQLPPGQKQEVLDNFKNFKELWKVDRARAKTEAERANKLAADLEEAKRNSLTPELKADYEHAAAIRRKFDYVSDPEFIQKYHAPIRSRYEQVLAEAVNALPDRGAAQAWAQHIAQNYQPEQLDRQWWLHSVIEKVPDPLDRQALLGSVTELLKLQKDRDNEITRATGDKSAFDNWIQEKTTHTAQRVQEEIMAEIGEQEKRIQEVLPLDVEKAKTADERAAIEAHNERFKTLNGFFVQTMQDLSKNGPRAWVRASVEATRAALLDGQYKEMQNELKSVKAERDQFKAELDKIAGARRKISQTSGTPPAPAAGSKKNGTGLSIHDLDVRKAMNDYDWGDT